MLVMFSRLEYLLLCPLCSSTFSEYAKPQSNVSYLLQGAPSQNGSLLCWLQMHMPISSDSLHSSISPPDGQLAHQGQRAFPAHLFTTPPLLLMVFCT